MGPKRNIYDPLTSLDSSVSASGFLSHPEPEEVEIHLLDSHKNLTLKTKGNLFDERNIIGKGSFGVVYKYECEETKLQVAIKHLFNLHHRGQDEKEKEKTLRRETENHLQLAHKHILTSYGFHEIQGLPCLVLDLAEKGSLSNQMHKKTFIRNNILLYVKQTLLGLEYLHNQKIVHRDLRCANILQKADNRIVIADFGLSKKIETLAKNTEVGNDYWKAPEVITDKIEADLEHQFLMDIWSLGVVILEMFYQGYWNIPYVSKYNSKQYMFHLGSGDVPSIPESAPKNIRDIIQSCLQYYVKDRKTANDLISIHFGFVSDDVLNNMTLEPLDTTEEGYCVVEKPQTPLTPHLGRKKDILQSRESFQPLINQFQGNKLNYMSLADEIFHITPVNDSTTEFFIKRAASDDIRYKVNFNEDEYLAMILDMDNVTPIYALRLFEKNRLNVIDCTQEGDAPCAYLTLRLKLFKKDKGILKDTTIKNSIIRVMSSPDLQEDLRYESKFLSLELKKMKDTHKEDGYTFDGLIRIKESKNVVARYLVMNQKHESAVVLSYEGTDSALITLIVCHYLQKLQQRNKKWFSKFTWKSSSSFMKF